MIEPTETENKNTLDAFADALIPNRRGGQEGAGSASQGAHDHPFGRMDEVKRQGNWCCAAGFPRIIGVSRTAHETHLAARIACPSFSGLREGRVSFPFWGNPLITVR